MVTLQVTTDQAATLLAALSKAGSVCQDRQRYFMALHESPKVGPVIRAESWQAYLRWQTHGGEVAAIMQQVEEQAPQDCVTWGRFYV